MRSIDCFTLEGWMVVAIFLGYIDLLEKRTPYKNTNQIKLKDFGIFLY